jgi:hypothetical protein
LRLLDLSVERSQLFYGCKGGQFDDSPLQKTEFCKNASFRRPCLPAALDRKIKNRVVKNHAKLPCAGRPPVQI